MPKIKISPSLLAADIANLELEINKIEKCTDMLHIDVMDGHFVPNISFGVPVVNAIRRITGAVLDVHLMISKPSRYIIPFAKAGSDMITIHVESPDNTLECLKYIKETLGLKSGIALNPDTSPYSIEKYIPYIDMVLQMTVFPGFGGQGLVEGSLGNLPILRQMIGDDIDLQVDGGIYIENIKEIAALGANVFVSGTGIFKNPDSAQIIRRMRKEASA